MNRAIDCCVGVGVYAVFCTVVVTGLALIGAGVYGFARFITTAGCAL